MPFYGGSRHALRGGGAQQAEWYWVAPFTHPDVSGVTFGGFWCSRFIASQPNAFNGTGGDKPDVADSADPGTVAARTSYAKPPWRYISYWNARKAASNACAVYGPGVHLLTAFEWASLAMLSHKMSLLPHGNNRNTNPPADVTYTTETAQLDLACNARNAGWYANLTGTGPNTWNLLHDPNGPADLNGNMWEWTLGLHMQTADEVVAIAAIDGNATTISVETATAHGLAAGEHATIAGTVGYNGVYVIATAVDTTHLTIANATHDLGAEATGTVGHQGHALVLASLDVSLAASPYGRSTAVGTKTLTDSDKSWTTDFFTAGGGAGATCYLMDGAGSRLTIASNTGNVLTTASGNPAAGPYEIVVDSGVHIANGMTSVNKVLTLRNSDARLKGFAIPATSDGNGAAAYGNDGYWFDTTDPGAAPNHIRVALRCGGWNYGTSAGVFALTLNNVPAHAIYDLGFRVGKAV
jgi:hypothetical protein